MNFLFDYDKDSSKIYIESENNVDNFFYSKRLYSFSDIATVFCTKDSDEIFGVFRNNLFENYNQSRKAQ